MPAPIPDCPTEEEIKAAVMSTERQDILAAAALLEHYLKEFPVVNDYMRKLQADMNLKHARPNLVYQVHDSICVSFDTSSV